jgi:hypothetical protein
MVDRCHLPDPSKDDAVDRPRPPVERRRCVLGENSTSADKRAIDATCTPAFRRRQLNAGHMQAASVTWCRWLGAVSSITGGAAIGNSRGFLPYRGSARLPRHWGELAALALLQRAWQSARPAFTPTPTQPPKHQATGWRESFITPQRDHQRANATRLRHPAQAPSHAIRTAPG